MRKRLEIRPIPTQRQRKSIKALPQVLKVEANGEQAWVIHTAYESREWEVARNLAKLGFYTKAYNSGWDLESKILERMKEFKRKKKRSKKCRMRSSGRTPPGLGLPRQ